MGVNGLKQQPITINKIQLDEPTNQSNAIHTKFHKLSETNHTIKKCKGKNTDETSMLPYLTENQTNTMSPTTGPESRTRPIIIIRTPRETRNSRRRLFRITRINYGQDKTVKSALDARELNENCVEKDHTCQIWKN